MKVGDLVVRILDDSQPTPGIIIDIGEETIEFDGDITGPYSCKQESFTIIWSDGTQSSEFGYDLEHAKYRLNENR